MTNPKIYFRVSSEKCFWNLSGRVYTIRFSRCYGEGGIWTLAPLLTTYSLSRGAPSASLGTSPRSKLSLLYSGRIAYGIAPSPSLGGQSVASSWISFADRRSLRRGWDSNPCAREGKRFSRPPRYDHFDTSPQSLIFPLFYADPFLVSAKDILTNQIFDVNHFLIK